MRLETEASIDSENRVIARPPTGSRIGPKRYGLDAVVQSGALLVAADEAEAGSTTQTIAATGHLASVGDFIQFTGGNLSGQTFAIESVATNTITLAQTLPEAPAATDGFDILRLVFYRVGASGEIVISGTVTADAGVGFAQAVNEGDDITSSTDLLPAAVKDGAGKAQALVQPTTPDDTQPVSGPLTDTQLRATAVPVSMASVPSHAVTNAGTFAVQESGDLLTEIRVLNGAYAMQTDAASATVTYKGWAAPGTATNAASWRIERITETSGDFSIQFADGDRNFDNIWDNRAALSYS